MSLSLNLLNFCFYAFLFLPLLLTSLLSLVCCNARQRIYYFRALIEKLHVYGGWVSAASRRRTKGTHSKRTIECDECEIGKNLFWVVILSTSFGKRNRDMRQLALRGN